MRNVVLRLLILSLLSVFCSDQIKAIDLSQIPSDDRARIERLFSYLSLDEGFAYTFFGSKPMCILGYDKNTPLCYRDLYPDHPLIQLESLWTTWEKYQYLFQGSQFLFFAKNGENWFEVILVNKIACLNVIENHLPLFRKKLGLTLSSIEIFDTLICNRMLFDENLSHRHTLIGLLLGYGKKNAIAFEKNYYSSKKNQNIPAGSSSHALIEHESDILMIPSFVSFSKRESTALMQQYIAKIV